MGGSVVSLLGSVVGLTVLEICDNSQKIMLFKFGRPQVHLGVITGCVCSVMLSVA